MSTTFINYLTPQARAPGVTSELILAFQRHFHEAITIGGTEPEFLGEFKRFKTKYQNEALQRALASRQPTDHAVDDAWIQSMMNHYGGNVDELLLILMGMGQLSNAFNLLGGNPQTARASSELPQEATARETPLKGKTRVTPRYVHVLGQMNAKNKSPQDPGPYRIPEEAKDKVPAPENIVLSLVEAMEQETEVLDFHDTKPYKDHWRAMKRPDFEELATTLFKHMNDLHKGVDYVEGFRYADRYQNLISLLQHCKGTIYFMSRPSTYEDVLLNPHMMELRFADNQKNNAKKKIDNRELTARRYQEYFAIHGCGPPPKERILKGAARGKKKGKRAAETAEENEGEASSVAAKPKRRKVNPKKGKGKATDSSASGTPLGNGEGSSVQGEVSTTGSPAFLGVSPLEEESLGNNQQYYISQQQFALQGGQYYGVQQHQPFPYNQQYPPQMEQPREIAKVRASHPQVATLDPTSAAIVPCAFIAEYMNVEQQIATTIYDCIQDSPVASKVLRNDLVQPLSELSVNVQQQLAQNTGHPTSRGNFSNTESEHGQIVHFQGSGAPKAQYQMSQQEPTNKVPEWYNQQNFFEQVSTSVQPADQQSEYQNACTVQQQRQPQVPEFRIPLTPDSGLSLVDPEWYGEAQAAEPKETAHVEESPVAVRERTTDEMLDDYLCGCPEDGDQQQTFTPGANFNKQMDYSQQPVQKTQPFSNGTGVDAVGFGGLTNIELDDDDFSGMGWGSQYLLSAPNGESGDSFFDSSFLQFPYEEQAPSGQIRMGEMEHLLAGDP